MDLIDLLDLEDIIYQIPQRNLRDCLNPLEFFSENELYRSFRFKKHQVIEIVLPLVQDFLSPNGNNGCLVSPMLQLLCALWFYSSGNFQTVNGDLAGIHQSTISRLVKKVWWDAMIAPTYQFSAPTSEISERYRNRKGWLSLNVQTICGPNYEVYNLVTRWSGSVHDSRIFDNSGVKLKFEERTLQGLLLGDSGYPQTRYLFTPILNPTTPAEMRYNRAHIATRNYVERTFGILKRRFLCLSKKMALKLFTTFLVITACVILHNIGQRLKQNINEIEEDNVPELQQPEVSPSSSTARGCAIKATFIVRHFDH